MYISVDDVLRRVKRAYISVDGVLRRVRRGYISVDGVTRMFLGSDGIAYRGTVTALQTARAFVGAAKAGWSRAIFAGGYVSGAANSAATAQVTAYTPDFVRSAPTALPAAASVVAGVSFKDQAIFVGGILGYPSTSATGGSGVGNVTIYDSNLTRSTQTAVTAGSYAGVDIGNHAIFALGNGGGISYAYDENMVRTTLTTGLPGYDIATRAGNNGIFAGRHMPTWASYWCNVCNENLVFTTTTLWNSGSGGAPDGGASMAGASVGTKYALYGFGEGKYGALFPALYGLDANLSMISVGLPSAFQSKRYATGVSTSDYAFFYGTQFEDVLAVNENLTCIVTPKLSQSRYQGGGLEFNGCLVIAGGGAGFSQFFPPGLYTNVDVYDI